MGTQVTGTFQDCGVFGKLGGGAVPPGFMLGGSLLEADVPPSVVLFFNMGCAVPAAAGPVVRI